MQDNFKKISALLITFNEEEHMQEVLENLSFADEIIVVDSFSQDKTVEITRRFEQVKLIQREFKNYTDQKSFALSQATNPWILFPDADERIPEPLKNEILEVVGQKDNPIAAYYFKRIFMYKNKRLYFSGWQSDKNFRLFKKADCHFDPERIVHETLLISGPTDTLKNKLVHYSFKNYEEYKSKMIRYGQMRAREAFKNGKKAHWYHFFLRPSWKFFNHYFLRWGILDGKKGLVVSYLNALGVLSRYRELKRLSNEPE